jgi:TatD DNase family protein
MGFCIGVGGVLTFKNSRLFEVIREIPISYIVLETDAPFLTPEPFRKYKNESKYIPVIAASLARYKGLSLEVVRDETTKNARRIFDI